MQIPLEITFRHMDSSAAVEANIREKAAKLERYFDRIIGCRVVIEAPHRHQHKGKLYSISINISVPGKELVVNNKRSKNHAHEDIYVAVRDTFNAAARKLEDHSRKVRGAVKTHEAPPHGKIVRLFSYEGYGFIEMVDGQEVYFHRNAVTNGGFDALEVGCEVRVSVAEGESANGPQASSVTAIGKHHIVI
jgi:ribosomal subunit interface protein